METRTPTCKVELLAFVQRPAGRKESDPCKFCTSNAGRVSFAALEPAMASITSVVGSSPGPNCSSLASGLESGKESLRRLDLPFPGARPVLFTEFRAINFL